MVFLKICIENYLSKIRMINKVDRKKEIFTVWLKKIKNKIGI
jgi:hypothetical protein